MRRPTKRMLLETYETLLSSATKVRNLKFSKLGSNFTFELS